MAPTSGVAPAATGPSDPAAHACENGISHLIQSLRQPMIVEGYFSSSFTGSEDFRPRVAKFFAFANAAAPGRIVYRASEVREVMDPTALRARRAGVFDSVPANQPPVDGYRGLAFEYGSERDAIRFIDRPDGMEYWIANKIRALHDRVDGSRHVVGVLNGHGEVGVDETMARGDDGQTFSIRQMVNRKLPFYSLVDLDTRSSPGDFPDAIEGLVVTQPERDLAEDDLRRIDRFVLKGKPVAVFASAVNVARGDPAMKPVLSAHGLDRLLTGYGIMMNRDLVIDPGSSWFSQGSRIRLSQVLDPSPGSEGRATGWFNDEFPGLFRVTQLLAPFVSSLELVPDRQPRATFSVLARSSVGSVRLTEAPTDLRLRHDWSALSKGSARSLAVSVLVSGRMHGALPGDEESLSRSPTTTSRVFVVSSSQIFANPILRSGLPDDAEVAAVLHDYQASLAASLYAFAATLDWLTAGDDLLACSTARGLATSDAPPGFGASHPPL